MMTSSRNNVLVNDLLDRHGVRDAERRKLVCELLKCSYATARRRILDGGWTTDEVTVLANHFGEPIENILGTDPVGVEHPCTLSFGKFQLNAKVSPGAIVYERNPGDLLAWEQADGRWIVCDGPVVPEDVTAFSVERLLYLRSEQIKTRPKIAAIDDDMDSLFMTRRTLSALGFEVDGYASAAGFLARLSDTAYDGYLVDWDLEGVPAGEILKSIRGINPHCPIFVLTGKLGTEHVDDVELAQAMRQLDLRLFPKPVPAIVVADQLNALISP
jgi:CheY-like chemotaxis protein